MDPVADRRRPGGAGFRPEFQHQEGGGRPDAEAQRRAGGGEMGGAVGGNELAHPGGAGGEAEADGEALQQAGEDQRLEAAVKGHQQRGEDGAAEAGLQHHPPPEAIGEPAQQQQAGQQAGGIAAEGEGSGGGTHAGALGIGGIERRLQIDAAGDGEERQGDAPGGESLAGLETAAVSDHRSASQECAEPSRGPGARQIGAAMWKLQGWRGNSPAPMREITRPQRPSP